MKLPVEMVAIPPMLRDKKLCRRFANTPDGRNVVRGFVAEMLAFEKYLEENLKTAREALLLAREALGES
jgi:hypothetical protein